LTHDACGLSVNVPPYPPARDVSSDAGATFAQSNRMSNVGFAGTGFF